VHLLLSVWLTAAAAQPETLVVPLQEIVVTGVRVPETALRVPAAISIVGRSRFDATRGMSLSDALGFVPGVLAQSRSGGQDVRVTIRGYGARGNGERSNSGVTRGIRILTDGIPITEPDGRTAYDLVDLGATDRIEVSRSNASALYGNASGGVINLRTNLDFASSWLEYRQQAGAWGFHREQALTGFAVGEGRGVFSLDNTTFDGWRAHSLSTATRAHVRFTTPLERGTRLGLLLDAVSDLNRFAGPLTREQMQSAPQQANATFAERYDRRRNRIGRVAVTFDRRVEDSQDLSFNLFVEPKALQRSERGRFRDFDRTHLGGSGVYQLRSHLTPALESRSSLGADDAFQDGAIRFYDLAPGGGRGTSLKANKREGANAAGGFMQQELIWNERWSARAALRYDDLWYIAQDFTDPTLDATKRFTHLTPKGSVAYTASAYTVYASLGGGVEAPAFNEIDPPPDVAPTSFNPFLEPMRSTTWELGAKGQAALPGRLGSLRYDAALYWIDVANDLVPQEGGVYFFTAGKTRRKGVELGLDWLPADRWLVSVTTTLSDNRYREYVSDSVDYAGRRVAGLPQVALSALALYAMASGLSGEVSAEHLGCYYADDANTARAGAYTLLNGSIGYSRTIGQHVVRAFVAGNNLTDQRYVASVFINGLSEQFYEPGLPRNWSAGLTLRWRWQRRAHRTRRGPARNHAAPGLIVLPDRQGSGVGRFGRPAPDCGQPPRARHRSLPVVLRSRDLDRVPSQCADQSATRTAIVRKS
jgi:iron complex outermembrane receptor protein